MEYTLYKIKSDKLKQWTDWCSELNNSRYEEALSTIKAEMVLMEAFVIFEVNDQWYTIGMSVTDGESATPSDGSIQINQQHKFQKKECLEKISKGKAAYILTNFK